jgi:uncharacterized membrane protein YfcA
MQNTPHGIGERLTSALLRTAPDGQAVFRPWGPFGNAYRVNHQEKTDLQALVTQCVLYAVAALAIGLVVLHELLHSLPIDIVFGLLTLLVAAGYYHGRTAPVRDPASLTADTEIPDTAVPDEDPTRVTMNLFFWFLITLGAVTLVMFAFSHDWTQLVIALCLGMFAAYLSQRLRPGR